MVFHHPAMDVFFSQESHPGRDFMGQGAPPISQQLKQLVDVEAQQLGGLQKSIKNGHRNSGFSH